LGSDHPIPNRSAAALLRRMPAQAVRDLTEWDPPENGEPMDAAEDRLSDLLQGELAVDRLIAASPDTPALTDDRPINEYYALRQWRQAGNPSASTRGSQ
jgi:hypothetical protein